MPDIVPPDKSATATDPGGAVPPEKAEPGKGGEAQDINSAATAKAAPPAAAVTVLNGKSEREIELERELGDANRVLGRTVEEKKQRETRIMELEDELKRLRQTPAEPKPLFSPFTFLND